MRTSLFAAALIGSLAASPAAAQVETPAEAWWGTLGTFFGLAGGPAYGQSELSTGVNIALLLGAEPARWRAVALRGEGAWNSFRMDDLRVGGSPGTGAESDLVIVSATANLELRLPLRDFPIHPYVVGGGGYYKSSESNGGAGFNAGGGIRFPLYRVRGLLEFRVHRYEEDAAGLTGRYVPVSFGVVF